MADHTHLTPELLAAILHADHPDSDRLLEQVLNGSCLHCLRVVADFLKPSTGNGPTGELATVLPFPAYGRLWAPLQEHLDTNLPAVAEEIREAERAFDEFAQFARVERQERLANESRYTSRAFVDRLLDASREARRSKPRESLEWAGDALTVLSRQGDPPKDQRVQALALKANALRAMADLRSASVGFAQARAFARDVEDEINPGTLAELDSLEASLQMNLQQFDSAEVPLWRALGQYKSLGQAVDAGRTLIKLGYLLYNAGKLEAAMGRYEEAVDLLPLETEPDLYLAARFNLALALVDLDRTMEAHDLLEWDEDVFAAHADDHLRIRRDWLEGRIAVATGRFGVAESLLVRTRDTFAGQGNGFDTALVSLDLALLYHHHERPDKIVTTLTVAAELFEAYALHRESLAALIMLQDAARNRAATVDAIHNVATYLRRAAKDPAARFSWPSPPDHG